ncbi:MAG: endonuclease III [Bacilli bacterium]|jgi:endonuclease-3|nr:endonuclease III [Bacilli bacterium]
MLKNRQELEEILLEIEKLFPNASCELVYHNLYELLIAVMLSAQTTDKSVNLVTPNLFMKYPTALSLSNAEYDDVKSIIARLGLSSNKAKNIIATSKMLVEKYNGVVPSTLEELITLPGVGRKTANVVLSEGYKIPRIAVDTHVERVSKRLGIVSDSASVLDVEQTLMKLIDEPLWHKSHHLLLFFGRYFCLAKKPNCENCFYKNKCSYNVDKNLQD